MVKLTYATQMPVEPYTVANMKKYQNGSSLIEGMIAILIFSFGVLGTMSYQSNMLVQTTQTAYRLAASTYVNSLQGAAESDPQNYACYTTTTNTAKSAMNCTSATSYMASWRSSVLSMQGNSNIFPSSVYNLDGSITISVYWKLPQEKSDVDPHKLVAIIHPHVGT